MASAIANLLGSGALQGISSVINSIRGKSPEDAAKLEAFKLQYAAEFQTAELDLKKTTMQIAAAEMQSEMQLAIQVNETMRAEANSPHVMQWAWRPLIGFVLAGLIANNYIFLPYFQGFGLKPIDVPDKVWEVLLAVVGVSALTRGGEKIASIFKGVNSGKDADDK